MGRLAAKEAALLLLRLIQAREGEKGAYISRFRISDMTLRRLSLRKRIDREFIAEMEDWLLDAGWSLFFAGDHYAMIRGEVVEGWARLSSKLIAAELEKVAQSNYDFKILEPLLAAKSKKDVDTGDSSDS